MTDSKPSKLLEEYEAARPRYEAFTDSCRSLIEKIISNAGIEVLAIDHRTKTIESFGKKIERPEKANRYNKLSDITDLSGLRIITYLTEERDAVCDLLKEHFEVDWENSVNKENQLDADRFGYTSDHIIISFKKDRVKLIEFSMFKDLKIEVQTRTILEHAWAAIDWKLRYKSEDEVPKPLRRRLFRISALLELADDEFSSVNSESVLIKKTYAAQLKSGKLDIAIDGDSLRVYMEESKNFKNYADNLKMEGVNVIKIKQPSEVRVSKLMGTIALANIRTVGELDELIINLKPPQINQIVEAYKLWSDNPPPGKGNFSLEGALRAAILVSVPKDLAARAIQMAPFVKELSEALAKVLALPPL